MDKYYIRLMREEKSVFARLVDSILIMLLVMLMVFTYTLVKLHSIKASIIITSSAAIMGLMILSKINTIKVNKFKKLLNKQIGDKLILEQIAFGDKAIKIEGYTFIGENEYLNGDGEKALLLPLYPESKLSPMELMKYLRGDYRELIASCSFDDDCFLLCSRLGIKIHGKEYLLEKAQLDIDLQQIEKEITMEVKKIGEIKNKRKATSFAREKWSKYLISCLLLLVISSFMGRYRIIYLAFSGMCMSFCLISLFVSKAQ